MVQKDRLYKSIVTFILLLALPFWVSAQEELSLSDAIKIGLERNYDIRIEEKNVEIAQNNNSWGEAGRFPNLTLNGRSDNSLFNNNSENLFFNGATFPGFELNNQRNYNIIPSVNLNWTLFSGNRVSISKDRLEKLELESEGNAEIVVSNAIQAIILGYYLAVLEKERLEVFKRQLSLTRDKYRLVEIRSEIGSAVSSDLLLEENNYLDDSVNYINQQLRYRDARRSLNFLLVEDDLDQEYIFTNDLAEEISDFEYSELIQHYNEKNIDLKTQYLSQSILKNNVQLARADRYPRLSMDVGYNWNRSVQDLRQAQYSGPNTEYRVPEEASVNKRTTYYANFTIAFTLFDGNRINRAINNALIQEDIGNIRLEKLQASIYKDIADSFDEYLVRKTLYSINERREIAAKMNLDITQDKFDNGTISSFDFRTIQINHVSSSLQKLESLFNLVDSKVSLMRLTGGIIETYVD